jgi:hypothetical protein
MASNRSRSGLAGGTRAQACSKSSAGHGERHSGFGGSGYSVHEGKALRAPFLVIAGDLPTNRKVVGGSWGLGVMPDLLIKANGLFCGNRGEYAANHEIGFL